MGYSRGHTLTAVLPWSPRYTDEAAAVCGVFCWRGQPQPQMERVCVLRVSKRARSSLGVVVLGCPTRKAGRRQVGRRRQRGLVAQCGIGRRGLSCFVDLSNLMGEGRHNHGGDVESRQTGAIRDGGWSIDGRVVVLGSQRRI